MNIDEIKVWAAETQLMDEKGLRGSKHQKQIIKIQGIIRRLAEETVAEDVYGLIHLKHTKCTGFTAGLVNNFPFLDHCSYLQNRVKWLVSCVLNYEGREK